MYTRVQAEAVYHWLFRLREFREVCPGSAWSLVAPTMESSLLREVDGLYVDAPVLLVPRDLALAVLGFLEDVERLAPDTRLAVVATADARDLAEAITR